MKGIEHYTSAAGFHVMSIHYTADPEKDPATENGRKWFEDQQRGYVGGIDSSMWRQEMEIDWDAAGGDLVLPQFKRHKSSICVDPFVVPEDWSLYASFDYGHRNPSAFHVHALDYDRDVYTIWEFYKRGVGYREIARAIRACPYFDRLAYPPIADPSIWALTQQQQNDNVVKSVAQLFMELPADEQVLFAPGKKGGDITVAELIAGDFWKRERLEAGEKPRWQIFKSCPMMIWEIERLRYADWSGTMQEQRNIREEIVDKDNHAWDGMKMFCTMFFGASVAGPSDPLEKLKHLDPASYRVWKSHLKDRSKDSRMGEFY